MQTVAFVLKSLHDENRSVATDNKSACVKSESSSHFSSDAAWIRRSSSHAFDISNLFFSLTSEPNSDIIRRSGRTPTIGSVRVVSLRQSCLLAAGRRVSRGRRPRPGLPDRADARRGSSLPRRRSRCHGGPGPGLGRQPPGQLSRWQCQPQGRPGPGDSKAPRLRLRVTGRLTG